jgi:hypothetical protein
LTLAGTTCSSRAAAPSAWLFSAMVGAKREKFLAD